MRIRSLVLVALLPIFVAPATASGPSRPSAPISATGTAFGSGLTFENRAANRFATATAGAQSGGDPYFPSRGNGGYDAVAYSTHTDMTIPAFPKPRTVAATTHMDAMATQDLTSFSLDFIGMKVSSVLVNKKRAQYRQTANKIIITPASPIATGTKFSSDVAYAGSPKQDADGMGWTATSDGGTQVGDPTGAAYWMPLNDHLADKALFTNEVVVPTGITAVSNGTLKAKKVVSKNRTQWTWVGAHPMVGHNMIVSIGKFNEVRGQSKSGVRFVSFIDSTLPKSTYKRALSLVTMQPDILDFLETKFGPYPLEVAGAVVDNAHTGFAFEGQTRQFYDSALLADDSEYLFAHELAHQWFAVSVSPKTYADTWLNEGFAIFGEWLWEESATDNPTSTSDNFDTWFDYSASTLPHGDDLTNAEAWDDMWSVAPASPGRDNLFSQAVYTRGAMTLELVRRTTGSTKFYEMVRNWAKANQDGVVSTDQFMRTAATVANKNLDSLFQDWLFTETKPTRTRY